MKFKDLNIGKKLALSFGLVLAIFIASTVFQLVKLNYLGGIQDEGAKRASDAIVTEEASNMGYVLYRVIADAIINRDLNASDKDWKEVHQEMDDDLALIESLVDTDKERQLLKEANVAAQEIIDHFENEMMPLLRNEFSEENELKIREIDGQIDSFVEALRTPLDEITESLNQETIDGDILFDETKSNVFNMAVILLIVSVLISIILVVIITRSITIGLKLSIDMAAQISNGDLTVEFDESLLNRKDEVGVLSSSLNSMMVKLKDIVTNIMTGADNIASSSIELSSTSQQISQGASEQASSAEEVSSSMEEMSSNIQQNTDNAMQTEKISVSSSEAMASVAAASEESLVSVREITEKINIINDIAFQTNILALNAAVEAARAGEHGRGFAVVAAEVRKLAERSKLASDEIVALSTTSRKVTEEAGTLVSKILPEIEKTSKLVQEISAASQEQNSGADQVNSAIQQLNQVTQQNAAASEEMATSSEELSSQAEQLKDLISFFNIGGTQKRAHVKKAHAAPKQAQKVKTQEQKLSSYEPKGVDISLDNTSDSEYEKF